MSSGIVGLGMYVPPEVRTNAWWPRDVVESWPARPPPAIPTTLTPGMRVVLQAAARVGNDPFHGVTERRVLATDLESIDMEQRAATEAIERARIARSEIDLLLVHRMVPEQQLANLACELHERLELSRACLSMDVEATAYSIFGQLAVADAMIAAGRVRNALLVQSCTGSRLLDRTNPFSTLLGDAATALVVGPSDSGLLALAHFTDGRYPRSLVMERGKLVIDAQQLFAAQLQIADTCKAGADAALARAGQTIEDIDFLAVFQGTAWLHDAVAEHLGTRARTSEVFSRYGYLSAAAIPATLYHGDIATGDLVLLTGGGTGQTYGGAVLRWGNA